jgi:hypothetical protein
MSLTAGKQLLLTSAAGSGAYQISRSLRFNSGDSSSLRRTPGTTGSRTTWTYSLWVKRSTLDTDQRSLLTVPSGASDDDYFQFGFYQDKIYIAGSSTAFLITTQVFRDVSAWMHIMLVADTTNATANNRLRLYVNGFEVTAFGTRNNPSSSQNLGVNRTAQHQIGSQDISYYFNGYLAEVFLIDGQALDPSSFTTTDLTTGQLIPKAYGGSYGTNGFKLDFADNSSNTATTLGKDTSGNGNNWTPNNFFVTSSFDSISFPFSGGPPTVDYLVVAGGGAGGGRVGGGGGAGGLLTGSSYAVTAGTSYSLLVGQGGSGTSGVGAVGGKGVNSIFGNLIAQGGGGGGTSGTTGLAGGSGGGASNFPTSSAGGVGTAGQGNNGGAGTSGANGCGGGGGSSTVGGSGGGGASGNGGSGTAVSITGASVTYAGGGGGGAQGGTPGTGTDGGGNGTADNSTAGAGAVNTGSGGGGGGYVSEPGGTGGAGGSGVVIIRYSDTYANLSSISAGLTYTLTVSGGYKIYRFTASTQYSPSIAAGNDSLVDTPTSYGSDTGVGGEVRGNYATLNNLLNTTGSYANGNLERTSSDNTGALGTICPSSGKWYAEFTWTTIGSAAVGVIISTRITSSAADGLTQSWQLGYTSTGKLETAGSQSNVTGFTTSDVIGVAFDSATGAATFYKNGSSIGTATSAAFASVPVGIGACGGGSAGTNTFIANFGQRAFAYPVSGYKALVDTNLPAPVVAKPNTVMDVKLYTGNGGDQTISGFSFSPDFIWTKSRSQAYSHNVYDSIRGTGKNLFANETSAENTDANTIKAFNSNGFQLGSNDNGNYTNGGSAVAWCWDAGTSTVTNTAGSITSQVRANATAGFSVMTYTGQTAAGTIGHGLGVAPSLIITKARSNAQSWGVYHKDVGINNYLLLDSTGASTSYSGIWGSSAPTSTVFGVPGDVGLNNSNTWTYVAYCFAPVSGYSSFGSYTGNGSSDGPFVFTGMRPRWIVFKQTNVGGQGWFILDTARSAYNVASTYLLAQSSNAEASGYVDTDFCSNGFKIRSSDGAINASGGTYIYAAFAESPFQYARAR